MNYSHIVILGRVGKEPTRMEPKGDSTPYTYFTLCCNSGYGDKQSPNWWFCKVYGDRFEKVLDYVDKGSLVLIDGEPRVLTTEKEGGVRETHIWVNVRNITLGPKSEKGGGGRRDEPVNPDTIPF